MNQIINCPNCQSENQANAKFCKTCGKQIALPQAPIKEQDNNIFKQVLDRTNKFMDAVESIFRPKTPGYVSQSNDPTTHSHQIQTVRTTNRIAPKQPGDHISYFRILAVCQVGRSNYYKTYHVQCGECKHDNSNSPNQVCARCNTPLRNYIVRESYVTDRLDDLARQRIKDLSVRIQGILTHNQIFYNGSLQYIVLDGFPDPWFSLGQDQHLPVHDTEKVITWLTQLGTALKHIHQNGYTFFDETRLADWMEPILVLKNQQAYFADITSCMPIQSDAANPLQKDIFYLVKVLYTMVTGDRQNVSRVSGPLLEIPAAFRDVIRQAQGGGFKTIDAFLNALQSVPKEPELARSLRQMVGYSTDVGKQRDHNEDYVGKFSLGLEQIPGTPEVGLYIVADGMGGHQAGEKASESVIQDVVINRIHEQLQHLQSVPKLKRATIKLDDVLTPGEILREAIQESNKVLLKARNAATGRDRGTTITAALVVGETCAIANVGDSRTYLLRNGKLTLITQDHSLVASLVAANMIKPSEVRSHPQRNQIYRTLGDKPEVEVDVFQKPLKPGDQLLLCSDGLWEMVLDEPIAKIMTASRTPQSACDRLIEAANTAGGEDNISVIVVWLE